MAMAMELSFRSSVLLATTVKKTTGRAKTCKCVRFDDKNGCSFKLNKSNIQNELMGDTYHYSAKCFEQLSRGSSPTSVATKKRFQKFQMFSEGLKLKVWPEGFQSFSDMEKRETVQKLVDAFFDELAAAMSRGPVQGVDTRADYPDDMQVAEGSARQFDTTAREDVDMQVNNLGQIQVDEVPAAAPNPDLGNTLSNDASLQNVAWNQRDNSQGRYPVPVKEDLLSFLSDISRRASRFRGRLPKFEWSEEAFRSFLNGLEFLEGADLEDDFKHSIFQ